MATNGTHSDKSQNPTGIITGGASGMGLAVAEDLAKKGWNLTILDLNEESIGKVKPNFDESRTVFLKVDVTNYEQQADAFVQTWNKWGRLDFVFANAGIGDRMNFYAPAKEFLPNGAPAKPNELVIDICLNAMVYSAYLALHYFRQNESKGGKIVFTSSMCG
jgi:15-hydroxyprostaglandin dehydrogenase (NAD)